MKKLLYSGMIALMTFFAVGNVKAEDANAKDKVRVTVQPSEWVLGTDAPQIGVQILHEEGDTKITMDSCSVVMTLTKDTVKINQTIKSTQVELDVEKLSVGDWAITYKLVNPKNDTVAFTGAAEIDVDSSTALLKVTKSEIDLVKVTVKPAKWILGSEDPIMFGVDIYREGGDAQTSLENYAIVMTLKKDTVVINQTIDATSGEVNAEKLTLGDWAISYKLVDAKDNTKEFEGEAKIDIEGSTELLTVAEAGDMVKVTVKPEKWEMGTDAPMFGVEIYREGGDAQTGFDDYFIMMTLTKDTAHVINQMIKSTQGELDAEKLSVGEWKISYKLVDAKDTTKNSTAAEIDPTSTMELTVVEKSANENNELAGVSVYPNPSNGEFNVVVPVSAEVEIFAANGAVVKRFAVAEGTTQVRLNNSGVYFVRFTAQNGQVAVKRVVVR